MNKQKLQLVISIIAAPLLGIIGFVIGKGLSVDNTSHAAMAHTAHQEKEATMWTCSMHPQIKLNKPGKCPICAMDLIPLKPGENLGPGEIKLSKTAEALANIEALPVFRKEFYFPVRMVGKISLDETRSKKITSRYAGRLDRLFVDYTGIQVRKGEHLFEIYSPALITAQEELLQAVESAKSMKNSTVEAIRMSSEKAVEASRDKLRLWGLTDQQIKKFEDTKVITDHVTTYSPTEGVVTKKHVDQGAYVKEGSVVYSIANLDYLWVELDAYESDLQWLHYAQEVSFTTEAWPGEEFKGRVSFIHPILNNKTRTVKVRVNVDNKDRRLKPGMFVRAEVRVNINAAGQVIDNVLSGKWISPMHPEVISDKPGPCTVCGMDLVPAEEYGFASAKTNKENPLLIPASAPLITGKRAVVYVKSTSGEGIYRGRTVTLGLKAGDYYIVKSGLKQGELVVTKGAFKIDSALQIQAKPSMMSLVEEKAGEALEVSFPFKKSLSAVFSVYDEISTLLSQDSIKGLHKKADDLIAATKAVDASKEKSEVLDRWQSLAKDLALAANLLKSSEKIDEARRHFEEVSIAAISVIKSFGTVEDINLAYCPMAFDDRGAYWLQKAPEVENPYFGSQMFHCGDIKEKFSSVADGASEENHSQHGMKERKESPKPDHSQHKVDEQQEEPGHDHSQHKMAPKFSDEGLASYLNVHKALSRDRLPETGKDNLIKALTDLKAEEKILTAVSSVYEAKSISAARSAFKVLSDYLIKKANEGSFLSDTNLAHCPMAFDGAGAFWLQSGDKVENPYYGSKMFRCGDIKKTLSGGK